MRIRIVISFIISFLIELNLFGQGVQHQVSFPLATYVQTNISDFGGYINRTHYNEHYIPNIRYEIQYRNYILGVDHFASYNYNEESGLAINEWNINDLNINSYSLFGGYQFFHQKRLKIKAGAGVSYNPSYITSYSINYFFEGSYHYEESKFGALFWSSIDYRLFDSFFVAFNLRYNPMFKPFWDVSDCAQCLVPHEKDRLNYLAMQLSAGYSF